MTYIPKTQETEYSRQMRLLKDRMDFLTSKVEAAERKQVSEIKLPDPNAEVPNHIKFAAGFVSVYQQTTMPHGMSSDINIEVYSRFTEECEREALASACELLADYFDRHNTRILRERQRAERVNQETRRRGKRTALRVTDNPEDFDE